MFNAKHYIPILRWKTAEKEALQKLAAGDKQVITPLLELVMPPRKRPKKGEKPKTAEDNLADSVARLQALMPTMPAQILKYWGSEPIFVDLNLFTDAFLKIWGYEEVMQKGYEAGIAPIPVVHLEDDTRVEDKIISLAKQHDSGVCLRVLRSDISKPDVAAKINALLSKHSLQKGQVDLLIDFELVEKMPTADYQVLVDTLSNIPDLTQWRTFIVAAGAFPFDLREFFANNTYRIPRTDWNYWFEKVYSSSLARKPAFADYTIQHPIYSEPNPSANPSASIRYTAEDKWVIVRGEALLKENGSGHSQYPSQAQLLSAEPEFKGESFSAGDAYIAEKAQDVDTPNTGNPRTWLRAGVNHHLVLTARQVSTLA